MIHLISKYFDLQSEAEIIACDVNWFSSVFGTMLEFRIKRNKYLYESDEEHTFTKTDISLLKVSWFVFVGMKLL